LIINKINFKDLMASQYEVVLHYYDLS